MAFPALRTLEALHLTIGLRVVTKVAFFDLCNELEAVAAADHVLKIVALKIYTIGETSSGDEWERLCTVFNNSGWSSLEHVDLDITVLAVHDQAHEELESVTSLLNSLLACISSRKSLDLSFVARLECPP